MYSEHCQTIKMEPFAKRIMPECRCATTNFSGHVRFVEAGHFNKLLVKSTRKRGHAGKHFRVFFPRYS